jgi:hypothetical protein
VQKKTIVMSGISSFTSSTRAKGKVNIQINKNVLVIFSVTKAAEKENNLVLKKKNSI